MLSKTAMALIPAFSLVGAAALAPTTSLAQSGENHSKLVATFFRLLLAPSHPDHHGRMDMSNVRSGRSAVNASTM